ncbi:glycerophosphoryl diester phosphodiesterase membrane domain-containing protein [Schaalia suimastitidis]|uniref:glycerophosphoryl diester phosphodiesterase membrane domain-containing protein n=1 Tax=Schaalia suimastitidis TaxID=121163 RepID=UPI00047A8735|nr:glycerophosphoryl diester phosphodiesterase membrane domain-containing protein [Schaalia suimastitidis]
MSNTSGSENSWTSGQEPTWTPPAPATQYDTHYGQAAVPQPFSMPTQPSSVPSQATPYPQDWSAPQETPPSPQFAAPQADPYQPGWSAAQPQSQQPQNQTSSWGTPPPPPAWGGQADAATAGSYAPAPASTMWTQPDRPGIIPLRPLGVGDLFEGTFRAIRSNPTVMFGFSVALMTIAGVVIGVMSYFVFGDFLSTLEDPTAAVNDDLTFFASLLSSTLMASLVQGAIVTVTTAFLSGMLAVAVSELVLGRVLTVTQTWERLRPRIGALIGTTLLTALASLAPMVVLVIPGIMFYFAGASDVSVVAVTVGITFLIFALAIGGSFFISMRLIYTPTITVLEHQGPVNSLKRSWSLTKGAFWKTCGRYILLTLVTGLAAGILGGVIGILTGLLSVFSGPALSIAVSSTLQYIVLGFVAPMTAGFLTLMYLDQRMTSEGLAPVLAEAARH